jgi:UDP-N-acetylmuramoyl-L-alanyl-D-glutamate--2,6-diaminopimelate ligase
VLVDYSHKPGAVEAVLTALRPVTAGARRSCSAAAATGPGQAPADGAAAARLADTAIFTNDNPRSEDRWRS